LGTQTTIWRKPHGLYYWLPPILWGLTILVMSGDLGSAKNSWGLLKRLTSWFVALTPAQLDTLNFYLRKTGHVVAYGFMYFLWFRAFRAHAGYGPWRSCLCALGFCLLFSSLDEGRQWLFPARGPSIRDVILDLSGSSLAALLTFAVWKPRTGAVPWLTGQHPAGSE
jgi:VanZ family protein